MRYWKSISFLFVVLLYSPAYAQLCYDNTLLYILVEGSTCISGDSTEPWPGELPTNCTIQTAVVSQGCLFIKYNICCDSEQSKYEDSVVDVTMVTVPIDQERQAAEAAFDTWKAQPTSLKSCALSYYQVGSIKTMKYDVYPSESTPGSSDVYVGFRSRTFCSKSTGFSNYSVIPLPVVNPGGSGGSVDMTQTNTLLSTTNTSIENVNTSVQTLGSKLDSVNTSVSSVNNTLNTVNSSVQTLGSKLDSVNTSLDSLNGGTYTGGDGSGQTDSGRIDAAKSSTETSLLNNGATQFQSFITDAKNTRFASMIGAFFNGAPTGGCSTMSVSAGRLGTHTIDFSAYNAVWTIMKALVLIMFSYVSIKIMFLGRG